MERTPSDYIEQVQQLISIGHPEPLVAVWHDSLGLGHTGEQVRQMLTKAIPDVAAWNKVEVRATFSEFVQHYDDVTSPLRKLPLSNGYVVIPCNQQVPYSMRDFFFLLQRTGLRGLRIIAANYDGRPSNKGSFEMQFLVRRVGKNLTFLFWAKRDKGRELYDDSIRGRYSLETNFLSWESDLKGFGIRIRDDGPYNVQLLVNEWFNNEYLLYDAGIRFPSLTPSNIFFLIDESDRIGQTFLLLPELQDDGGYAHSIFQNEVEYSYISITSLSLLISAQKYTSDDYPLEHYTWNSHCYSIIYSIDEEIDEDIVTSEERASYLAWTTGRNWDLTRRYKRSLKRFNLYVGAVQFNSLKGYEYMCINTDAEVLCLVTNTQLPQTKDYQVVSSRYAAERALLFYYIKLNKGHH